MSLKKACRVGKLSGFFMVLTVAVMIFWGLSIGFPSIPVSARGAEPVMLEPGQDLQAIVEGAESGTHFILEPGLYRGQAIRPKDKQKFTGRGVVILSGAVVLEAGREQSDIWSIEGLPDPLPASGDCYLDLCGLPNDLFVDDKFYRRVASSEQLASGSWLQVGDSAFLADDARGKRVEMSVTPLAFGGTATGVELENLVIEKYASAAQYGAIDLREARGWTLTNIVARWNHGVGLIIGPDTTILGGSFSNNGQMGMGGTGNGSVIDGSEIAFNNYAGFDAGWEAGGAKFTSTEGLTVRNSCVHNNEGPGLWTDIDNVDVLYEGNRVFSNANDGIKHEISYDVTIRDNLVAGNGHGHDIWLWGSQILIQNSQNAKVHDNVVQVDADFGHGISVVQQERGEGVLGAWDAKNNHIHDNSIAFLGERGLSGIVSDIGDEAFWRDSGNRYDGNNYVTVSDEAVNWAFNDSEQSWADVIALGYEKNGKHVVRESQPKTFACALDGLAPVKGGG